MNEHEPMGLWAKNQIILAGIRKFEYIAPLWWYWPGRLRMYNLASGSM